MPAQRSMILLPVCWPVCIQVIPELAAATGKTLRKTVQAVNALLESDFANTVYFGSGLVSQEAYLDSSSSVWRLLADYVGELDRPKRKERLNAFEMHEVVPGRTKEWYVLPGLLAAEGKPSRGFGVVAFKAKEGEPIEMLLRILETEAALPPGSIVHAVPGLVYRPFLPYFQDLATTLQIQKMAGTEPIPRPIPERLYCSASWPKWIETPERLEIKASQLCRKIKVADPVRAEKLKEAGWEPVVGKQRKETRAKLQ